MKSLLVLFGVFLLAPAAALADNPFDGTWFAECEGDLAETVIGDGRIVANGIACEILDVERIGGEGQVWRTTHACAEDEETWTEEVLFGLETDVDGKILHLVEVGMDDGYVLTYVKCD